MKKSDQKKMTNMCWHVSLYTLLSHPMHIHAYTYFLFIVRGKYECSCLMIIASFLIIMEYLSEMYTLLASFFFKEVSCIAVLALPKAGFGRYIELEYYNLKMLITLIVCLLLASYARQRREK